MQPLRPWIILNRIQCKRLHQLYARLSDQCWALLWRDYVCEMCYWYLFALLGSDALHELQSWALRKQNRSERIFRLQCLQRRLYHRHGH